MYSNYSIIIDKGECHEYYVHHNFRDIFSWPKSTFNHFVVILKDYWETVTEVSSEELTHNATEKYNKTEESK